MSKTVVSRTESSGWKQGWIIPFMSKYKLSTWPLGLSFVRSTGKVTSSTTQGRTSSHATTVLGYLREWSWGFRKDLRTWCSASDKKQEHPFAYYVKWLFSNDSEMERSAAFVNCNICRETDVTLMYLQGPPSTDVTFGSL